MMRALVLVLLFAFMATAAAETYFKETFDSQHRTHHSSRAAFSLLSE
jgi:hypothetical protein